MLVLFSQSCARLTFSLLLLVSISLFWLIVVIDFWSAKSVISDALVFLTPQCTFVVSDALLLCPISDALVFLTPQCTFVVSDALLLCPIS